MIQVANEQTIKITASFSYEKCKEIILELSEKGFNVEAKADAETCEIIARKNLNQVTSSITVTPQPCTAASDSFWYSNNKGTSKL